MRSRTLWHAACRASSSRASALLSIVGQHVERLYRPAFTGARAVAVCVRCLDVLLDRPRDEGPVLAFQRVPTLHKSLHCCVNVSGNGVHAHRSEEMSVELGQVLSDEIGTACRLLGGQPPDPVPEVRVDRVKRVFARIHWRYGPLRLFQEQILDLGRTTEYHLRPGSDLAVPIAQPRDAGARPVEAGHARGRRNRRLHGKVPVRESSWVPRARDPASSTPSTPGCLATSAIATVTRSSTARSSHEKGTRTDRPTVDMGYSIGLNARAIPLHPPALQKSTRAAARAARRGGEQQRRYARTSSAA